MSNMTTGITIFICIVVSCGLFYIGYLAGCKYATEKVVTSLINAMFDLKIDPKTIEEVISRGRELVRKEIKEK